MSGKGYIAAEAPRHCEMCNSFEECRPYGPQGEWVCFKCGMKDEAATKRAMNRYIYGAGNT